jgi:hypothetical protein
MNITISKRVLGIIIAISLFLSALNTYIIITQNVALQNAAHDATYDYVIFQDGATYKAINQASGATDYNSDNASQLINQVLANGYAIYFKPGNYTLNSDVQVHDKINAKIVSDGANIIGEGNSIIIKGDNYTFSQNNLVQGFTIINGTLRIENSFGTIVSNMEFVNCSTAIELANTATWTEGTIIENCRFANFTEGIVFRTPTETGTGSYASSQVNHCFFNHIDDSIGITVEPLAEFSDSQIQNSRMWMGENDFKRNQTGLQLDGSMHQTLLSSVVFESFADSPTELYGISLGETSVTPPTLAEGNSFLGNWTAKVHNPYGKWIGGVGGIFKQVNLPVFIGSNNQYGEMESVQIRPLTIASFKPKIQVTGSFVHNETVTVRIRLEFIDKSISGSVEKSFTNSSALWLDDDDMLRLFPSESVIWTIMVDAKVDSTSTDATAQVSLYGITT